MPQPIIFQRAPLVQQEALPLNPGQVLPAGDRVRTMLAALPDPVPDDCLEGAVRLCACGADEAARARVASALAERLALQGEDGSFPMGFGASLSLVRAVWFQAMATGDRGLFAAVNRWLSWLGTGYDGLKDEVMILRTPADLAELLLLDYRQLGSQGALRLLARLRRDAEDWATRLGSFSLDRPLNRRQLAEGLSQAEPAQHAYWMRQAELANPVCLADGFRAVHCFTCYSGNRSEAEAGERAWGRLQRWHGAACGGVTGVDSLLGRTPDAAIGADSLGAWMEALAPYAAAGEAWACDALERILANALPAALHREPLAVNRLDACGNAEYKAMSGRLLRGYAAAMQAAVAAEPDGLALRLWQPGVYGLRLGDGRVRVKTGLGDGEAWLTVHPDEAAALRLTLRVPAWMEDARVTLNGAPCGVIRDGLCTLEQTWRDGDRLAVSFTPALRVETGYHQSRAVYRGPELLALPVEPGEPCAFCLAAAERDADGGVAARLIPAKDWRMAEGQPVDVPVLPAHDGEECRRALVPFASLTSGVAVFAGNAGNTGNAPA